MTAQQEGRLLESFHENKSLLPHGGMASITKILNSLGDDKAVEEFEAADRQTVVAAPQTRTQKTEEDTSIFSRRERMRDTTKHGCDVS